MHAEKTAESSAVLTRQECACARSFGHPATFQKRLYILHSFLLYSFMLREILLFFLARLLEVDDDGVGCQKKRRKKEEEERREEQ